MRLVCVWLIIHLRTQSFCSNGATVLQTLPNSLHAPSNTLSWTQRAKPQWWMFHGLGGISAISGARFISFHCQFQLNHLLWYNKTLPFCPVLYLVAPVVSTDSGFPHRL